MTTRGSAADDGTGHGHFAASIRVGLARTSAADLSFVPMLARLEAAPLYLLLPFSPLLPFLFLSTSMLFCLFLITFLSSDLVSPILVICPLHLEYDFPLRVLDTDVATGGDAALPLFFLELRVLSSGVSGRQAEVGFIVSGLIKQ